MNKRELIKEISKETDFNESDVRIMFNAMIDIVKAKLRFGVDINIKDFVKFERVIKKARKGRNPKTGEPMDIPKRYSLKAVVPEHFRREIAKKPVY